MPRLADLALMALVVLVLVGSLLEERDIRKAHMTRPTSGRAGT